MKKVVALIMASVFAFSLAGCKKSEDKKETVYVTADPYGNAQKTEVEVILRSPVS